MIGRVAYAALFCIAVPLGLLLWTKGLAQSVQIPAWHSPLVGGAAASIGLVLMLASWWTLWFRGGGLPMNAFPPTRRVRSGAYALVADPNYLGAVLVVAGLSICTGSAAGLWVVAPIVAIACVALVIGYEYGATVARLGLTRRRPWLSLPPNDDEPAAWPERWACLVLTFVPWLIAYEWVGHIPVHFVVSGWVPGEHTLAVFPLMEPLYASVYLVAPAACLACPTRRDLRQFALTGWIATGIGCLLYVALPITTPPRAFDDGTWFGWLLALERADGLAGR